jgi:diaminobutyrate-2-oxoglutarate transaminase
VVIYRRELDLWRPGAHAGTFRGNQLAFAAGAATIRFVREQGLDSHAAEMGRLMRVELEAIARDRPCIGDVRGRGLMIGIEIVDKDADSAIAGLAPASPKLARKIQHECLRRGLIVELGGRHGAVVRMLPPLIVTPSDVEAIIDRFREAVEAAADERLSA